MTKLISFDIDGTLEVGDPPGSITMEMVRRAKRLGYLIGSCSDRTVSAQQHEVSDFPLRWPLEQTPYTLVNHANVFSREKLDQGARFFLQHLPETPNGDLVIDLGCGNGVLSLALLSQNNDIQLICADESYMAV